MIFGLGVIVGAIGMALLFLSFVLPELRGERDEARREIKVYRNLLIPGMAKADPVPGTYPGTSSSASVTQPIASPASGVAGRHAATPPLFVPKPAAASSAEPKTAEDVFKLKIPYRDKFKLLMRLTNSKQVRTDTLASALQKQKPIQEKHNVIA